ncbi:hypothetical protein ACS0TY_000540 [Phlomoides rotata]
MHLWPSMKVRDSFKKNYSNKLDWNLHRMNIEQQRNPSNTNQQKLLETEKNDSENSGSGGIDLLCREILVIISCCYCCFCCGACVVDEER